MPGHTLESRLLRTAVMNSGEMSAGGNVASPTGQCGLWKIPGHVRQACLRAAGGATSALTARGCRPSLLSGVTGRNSGKHEPTNGVSADVGRGPRLPPRSWPTLRWCDSGGQGARLDVRLAAGEECGVIRSVLSPHSPLSLTKSGGSPLSSLGSVHNTNHPKSLAGGIKGSCLQFKCSSCVRLPC